MTAGRGVPVVFVFAFAIATFGGALAIAVIALLVASAAFVVIWMEGLGGMRAALAAMAISFLLLLYPACQWYAGVKRGSRSVWFSYL